MSRLLEMYCRTAGEAAKRHTNYWNGPCPFCTGTDRFIVWPDRDENLGEVCSEHGVKGVWSCRQCRRSGDTIAYLMETENMSFAAACAELNIPVKGARRQRRGTPKAPADTRPREFKPHTWNDPSPEWQAYAKKLFGEAREAIPHYPNALDWLARRGIDRTAVEYYGIGYLPGEGKRGTGRFRHRSALGLPPRQKPDGSDKPLLYIPRGIVIPMLDASGNVLRLRFRRPRPDVEEFGEKYMVLEGSCPAPMLLEPEGLPPHLAVYDVTEAELDAIMVHYQTGRKVGAIAALTNLGKPDASQHPVLQAAARVLVSLDFDTPKQAKNPDGSPRFHEDGSPVLESAGANGWAWWRDNYRNAHRWPTPDAKDPGDAFTAGVDIRAWMEAGLPASFPCTPLPAPAVSTGSKGVFSSGLNGGGEGVAGKGISPLPIHAGGETGGTIPVVDRKPLEERLRDLSTLMRCAIGYTVTVKPDGCLSFAWDRAWASESDANWAFLGRLQNAILHDDAVFAFIIRHPDSRVTAGNLTKPLENV